MWRSRTFPLLLTGSFVLTIATLGSSLWPAKAAASSHARQQDQQKDSAQDQVQKLSSTLIQVPTIVTDRTGKFVADLTENNFTVLEDGKRQEVGTFAAVKEPFNAVLVLDTSNSAEDRLKAIQYTALSFIKKMAPDDRATVICFDHDVRQLTEFTSNHDELNDAVRTVEAGFGKLLYEAVGEALNQLKQVDGRRAVILFTDGVDLDSIEASSQGTIALAQEVGATIYCVQFDTRWWIESNARKQQAEEDNNPNISYGADGRIPLPGGPMGGGNTSSSGPRVEIDAQGVPTVSVQRENGRHGTITENLDAMYNKADAYLKGLSDQSGGKLFKAYTAGDTEKAFGAIVDELHNQYMIGYYPGGSADGKYHHIKVQVDRKDLLVRARQGYKGEKQ